MNNHVITVIIPCYNVENYIYECMDSIINQTIFDKLSVIIINDGSTDSTGFILRKYSRKYDNIELYEQENKGQSAARNFGLTKVSTPFFAFIDSDDWVSKNYYEALLSNALEYNSDVSVCLIHSVDNESGIIDKLNSRDYLMDDFISCNLVDEREEYIKKFLEDRITVSPCNKIYRTDSLSDIMFSAGLYNEDMEYMLNVVIKADVISKTNEAIYFYRKGIESTTTNSSIRVLDMLVVLDKIKHRLREIKNIDFLVRDFELFFGVVLTLIRVREAEYNVKKEVVRILNDRLRKISLIDILRSKLVNKKRKIVIIVTKYFPFLILSVL